MSLILLLCLAGAIAFLIKKAPFIDEPYKGYALWVLLVIVVFVIINYFFGLNFELPRRR